VRDGRIVQRARGGDWRHGSGDDLLAADEQALLLLPTGETALHWVACPGMTPQQGAAAAPLLAIEASLGSSDDLHAATPAGATGEDAHVAAVIARPAMDYWMARCAAAGVPDAAIVPAGMILPPSTDGYAAGRVGAEDVLRGPDCVVGALEPHAPLIVGDAPIDILDADSIDACLVAALAQPPLDLRQGRYARRGARLFDGQDLRIAAALVGLIALVALLAALVSIVRYNLAAGSLDRQTVELARSVAPQLSDAADANARLSAMAIARGGAGGLSGMAAAVMTAMRGVPSVSLGSLSMLADGSLRVRLVASRPEDINKVLIALQNAGWRIAASGVQQQGAQMTADIVVMPS